MIEHILAIVDLDAKDSQVKLDDTPDNAILQDNIYAKQRKKWHNRSALGCLSYIPVIVHLYITFPVNNVQDSAIAQIGITKRL